MTTHAPNVTGETISVLPDQAVGVTCTDGGAATYGSYVEVDDGSGVPSDPFRIVALVVDTPSGGDIFQIELAHGAAASETPIATAKIEIASDAGGFEPVYLPPSGSIDGSTRIAARASSMGGGNKTINVSVMVQEI